MPYIQLLGTGGTISSRSGDQGSGATASDSAAQLVSGLKDQIEVRSADILTTGSYLLTFADLRILQQAVSHALAEDECLGVVITHGTDTMEETAFLLDLVHTSAKPVVLTGAQRTADSRVPDGPDNLRDAISVAAAPQMRDCGVLICFAGEVRSARGARKAQTWSLSAFEGGTRVATLPKQRLQVLARPLRYPPLAAPSERFDQLRVEIVPCYLGAVPEVFAHVIGQRVDGIVLMGTGIGNAGSGFADQVSQASQAGIPVVLSSRVAWGPTIPVYGNGGGVDLVAAGAIPAGELGPYQARILAALLLADEASTNQFKQIFERYG